MPQQPRALDFAIPSDVQYIEGIVAQVTARCAELDFPARLVSLNVPVALTEVLANAILRGNGDQRGKFVHVRAQWDDMELVVEVLDEGTGFDLDACTRDPTTPERLEREDGRGLFMMRNLVDHVEQYVNGGNIVRFTVRRA